MAGHTETEGFVDDMAGWRQKDKRQSERHTEVRPGKENREYIGRTMKNTVGLRKAAGQVDGLFAKTEYTA